MSTQVASEQLMQVVEKMEECEKCRLSKDSPVVCLARVGQR
jgi:uncharacterized protein (UPF0335 family)